MNWKRWMGLFGVLLCAAGCAEEPETPTCEGDACVEEDVVTEVSHPFCADAHLFTFAHGDVWISVLDPSGGDRVKGALEINVRVLKVGTQEVLEELSTGIDGSGLAALAAVSGVGDVQIELSVIQSEEEGAQAIGRSAPYSGATEHVAVVLRETNGWSATWDVFSCEETQPAMARFAHQVVTLEDGRVVVIGGVEAPDMGEYPAQENLGLPLDSVEVYDPATGQFSVLESHLKRGRAYHTATLLGDGTILVAGGLIEDPVGLLPHSSAEIIDLRDGAESISIAPFPLQASRARHSAVYVPTLDGVLIVGGAAGSGSSEFWRDSGSLVVTTQQRRAYHSLSYLPDLEIAIAAGGEVLNPDGSSQGVLDNIEIFQLSGTVMSTGVFPLSDITSVRTLHKSVYLEPSQQLLLIGGFRDPGHDLAHSLGEVWHGDTQTSEFFLVGGVHGAAATHHLQSEDLVLVAGGTGSGNAVKGVEILEAQDDSVASNPAPSLPMAMFGGEMGAPSTGGLLLWAGCVQSGGEDEEETKPTVIYTP